MQGQTLNPTAVGSETVASFLALHSVVTVTSATTDTAVFCEDVPFHWNGTELVICSIGTSPWPRLASSPVDVLLVAGTLQFQFQGDGSTDEVVGIAPEYREQLVTYLGSTRGHAAADQAGATAITHRLFINPHWSQETADR